MTSNNDKWALCRRPPVIIPPEERDAIERQWAIFAAMTPEQRLNHGLRMSQLAMQQRRERLQRQYPKADARGISWAIIREIEQLEPGINPITYPSNT